MSEENNKDLIYGNDSTNGMAIAGFVLGLISLFINILGIISILAIVFSSIGLSKVSKTKQKGKVFSIIGLISGIIALLYSFFWIF